MNPNTSQTDCRICGHRCRAFAGLFSEDHMDYEVDRLDDKNDTQPSLKEMTEKAIRILQRSASGFFLLVEGRRHIHVNHLNIEQPFGGT